MAAPQRGQCQRNEASEAAWPVTAWTGGGELLDSSCRDSAQRQIQFGMKLSF